MRLESPPVLLLLAALGLPLRAASLETQEWRLRQNLAVDRAGPVRVALPVETLDAARPDLADLRLLAPSGQEVPYVVEQTRLLQAVVRAPKSLNGRIEDNATVFDLETGTNDRITALQIDAGPQRFLTRALVEASDDGTSWRLLGRNLPVYDRGGPLRALHLPIPPGIYPRLRVSLERLGGPHVVVRTIRLETQRAQPEATEPVAVRVTARDESPGETRLTLALPGANLFLAALEFRTPERVFSRSVRVLRRVYENEMIREETLVDGTLARAEIPGAPDRGPLRLPLETLAPQRELTVVIVNGDSPPLALTAVSALRRPVYAAFDAAFPGLHVLLVGNPRATAPQYDVSALAAEGAGFQPAVLTPGALEANPDFHPGEPLPEIPAPGAPLDVTEWSIRRPVRVVTAGIQQLELDPPVLAHAQRGLGDLRLLRDDRQVPFVLEQTSLSRPLAASVASAPDPAQPRLSRWRLTLPYPHLPVTRLTATVSTPLFRRDVRLLETLEDDRGYTTRRLLGQASWSRTPGQPSASFLLPLGEPPETATLWLECDDGDNPPISLVEVHLDYGASRLLFKADGDGPVFLYYGNPQAAPPRYDLSLVGSQLLAAEKAAPGLGPEERLKGPSFADTIALAGRGGWLFWGMLALVVVVLLAVIARLLPQAPPPGGPAAPG